MLRRSANSLSHDALAMCRRDLIENFLPEMPRKSFNIKLLSIFELKNVQKSRKARLVS